MLCSCLSLKAQETVYIPPSSTIGVGGKQGVGIFGNFINDGNLSIPKNGKVHFLGKIFKNSSTAKLTDSSAVKNSKYSGNIVFQQPNPVYGHMGQQLVESGYSDSLNKGPQFSNITINNAAGIWLTSDMNVLDAVTFQQGHVFLNKYVTALGDSTDFGGVNGYTENRYFVTGTGIKGGSLKISSLASCCIVTYPIGADNKHYTPIQLRNTGAKNDFYVRAFSNVYSNATNGAILTDTTLKVTWTIAAANPGASDVEVLIQNDKDVETQTFTEFRDRSYISTFRNNSWEMLNTYATAQLTGTITNGAAIYTAVMNFRRIKLSNQMSYITKRVNPKAAKYPVTNAFSPNGDGINDVWNLPFLINFPGCRVQIFNRNGGMIYTSTGYDTPWDGTIAGRPAPVGTYYYIIDLRNGEKPLAGSITLLR